MTIEQIAEVVFGTPDYQAALSVLSPSSEVVRKFKKLVKEHVKGDNTNVETTNR